MFSCRRVRSVPVFSASFDVGHREFTPSDDGSGNVVECYVSDTDCPLPDPDDYDIDRLLKAGVPLQETRTNCVSADVRSFVDEIENAPSSEVNNEQ